MPAGNTSGGGGGGGGGSSGGGNFSGAIWVLGLVLVIAVSATSPYWQTVGAAVTAGDLGLAAFTRGMPNGPADFSGLALTAGAFLLVVILAGVAEISEGAGAFALVLLIGLWVLFLLGHTRDFTGFFSLLGGGQKA